VCFKETEDVGSDELNCPRGFILGGGGGGGDVRFAGGVQIIVKYTQKHAISPLC
jgi:hypothetical protein